jgi:putative flippase GtrA
MQLSELLCLFRFGIIGLVAAAIHYWMIVALVELGGMAPLLANLGGFASALWCSYFGHRHWTFVDQRTKHATHRFFRFLAVAMLGFLLNQLAFDLLLTHAALPYFILIATVVVVAAALTYMLTCLWAFRLPRPSLA